MVKVGRVGKRLVRALVRLEAGRVGKVGKVGKSVGKP